MKQVISLVFLTNKIPIGIKKQAYFCVASHNCYFVNRRTVFQFFLCFFDTVAAVTCTNEVAR